jgi:hypothetical protein
LRTKAGDAISAAAGMNKPLASNPAISKSRRWIIHPLKRKKYNPAKGAGGALVVMFYQVAKGW